MITTFRKIKNKNFLGKKYLKSAYHKFFKYRNTILNINTHKYWDNIWLAEKNILPEKRLLPILFNQIASLVPAGKNVVDIGCGIGILMKKLQIKKECSVFGIDISKEAISFIKSKGMDGNVGKVPPIPLESKTFDVAIATELIEHVANPQKLLTEIARIIKNNGMIIISTPNNALRPQYEREHIHLFTERSLKMMLNKDFKNTEIFKLGKEREPSARLIGKGIICRKSA